jgi:Alkylmercury lyase
MGDLDALDQRVRQAVYAEVLASGRIPGSSALAAVLNEEPAAVRAALDRLAAARVLVLQPGGEILMAPPFSAVPTPFLVTAGGWETYGNCIWDALGALAMKREDGRIRTACGCCGQAMEVEVRDGAPRAEEGVLHFAVPARRWWEDIVYT